jgi:type II secretory pathway pseudopilin PulG
MKKLNKNGFTVYSLVIAIAALAIISAVIIPTFAGVVNKANENNYVQAKTAQQMVDMVAELDNEDLLTWEVFEAEVAKSIGAINVLTDEAVQNALVISLEDYFRAVSEDNTLLTEDQVKLIIVHTLSTSIEDAQAESVFYNAIAATGNPGEYVGFDNGFSGDLS